MQARRDEQSQGNETVHPLKTLTAEQFMALGGNAVAYVRPILGGALAPIIAGEGEILDDNEVYQLVMSADGTPLMVADSADAVAEWLSDRHVGLVSLH